MFNLNNNDDDDDEDLVDDSDEDEGGRKSVWLFGKFSLNEWSDISHQLIFKFHLMSTFKKEKAPLKPTRKARNELTEEQKQEIKEAFDLFDTDGVGTSWII